MIMFTIFFIFKKIYFKTFKNSSIRNFSRNLQNVILKCAYQVLVIFLLHIKFIGNFTQD